MFQHPLQTLHYHTTSPAEWVSAVFISSLTAAVSIGAWPIIPTPNTDTFVQHGDEISTPSLPIRRHLDTAVCRSIIDLWFDFWLLHMDCVLYGRSLHSACLRILHQLLIPGSIVWWNEGRRTEMLTEFWRGNLKERGHLGSLGIEGGIQLTLILRRSPYGNGMVLHFYQQQESSTTKTVHKVINKRLKTYV